MPVSLIAKTASSTGTAAGSTSAGPANIPTGTLNGHLLVWAIYGNNATAMSTPSGWNVLHAATGTAQQWGIFWRVADAEPASYTHTVTSSRWAWAMLTLAGVDTVTPEDVASGNTNGTTAIAFPAITPTTAGAWVLAFGGSIVGAGVTNTTYSSGNLDVEDIDGATDGAHSASAGNANAALSIGHELWASGAFTPTMTGSNVSTRTSGVSSALRPARDPNRRPRTPNREAVHRASVW